MYIHPTIHVQFQIHQLPGMGVLKSTSFNGMYSSSTDLLSTEAQRQLPLCFLLPSMSLMPRHQLRTVEVRTY